MVHHGGTVVLSHAVEWRAQGYLTWEWDSALCGSAGSRPFTGCGSTTFGDCLLSWPHIRVPGLHCSQVAGGTRERGGEFRGFGDRPEVWMLLLCCQNLVTMTWWRLPCALSWVVNKCAQGRRTWCHVHPGFSSRKATCCITYLTKSYPLAWVEISIILDTALSLVMNVEVPQSEDGI